MDYQEAQQQQQETQEWAACDPFTLVTAAKHSLFTELSSGGGSSKVSARKPIEEIISRFEHLTRATVGAAPTNLVSSSRQS